jgi:phospholipid transport system transporter-binding protein
MAAVLPLPALPAQLTHAQATDYLTLCTAALGRAQAGMGSVAVLDASALQDFDSSVLAALLAVRRRVVAAGGELTVQGLPERLRNLAALYGVSELLPE